MHLSVLLPLQESLLLHSTLLNVDKEEKPGTANQAQREQEIERTTVVASIIDNGRADQWADESTRLSHDREQTEKKKFFPSRCDLGDHGLRIAVPRTDKQSIESLVYPNLPLVMETEALRPDADHAPAVEKDDAYGDDHEHGLGG